MSYKDILVLVDAERPAIARVELARELARTFDAHLEVRILAALPDPPLSTSGAAADAYDEAFSALTEAGKQALEAVCKLDRPGELFSAYIEEAAPEVLSAVVAAMARMADLVVTAQPTDQASALEREFFRSATFAGGSRCLLVPEWETVHTWGKRILIAWKATPEAAHAMAGAMPLLSRAEAVRVCIVDPRGGAYGEDERALARLQTHLLRHGVKLEALVERRADKLLDMPEQLIEAEATSFGADLVVMGAYGHPRWQEWAFGGVTQALIKQSSVPLFVAH